MRTLEEIHLERRRLEEEREAIISASTSHRLEVNRQRMAALADEERELRTQASKVAGELTDEEKTLRAQITESMKRERAMLADANHVLSDRFIRPDAIAHHEAIVKAKAEELQTMQDRFGGVVNPGPRIVAKMQELRSAIDRWPSEKKRCEIGEQIHALRAERKRLVVRRDELQEQRQRAALSAAGTL